MAARTVALLVLTGVATVHPAASREVDPSTGTRDTRFEVPSAEHVPADAYNQAMAGKTDLCPDRVCDAPPALLEARAPVYPGNELRAGIEGRASISFEIGADGLPRRLAVHSATSEAFGLAALEAVRTWRFRPATLNGAPVAYGPALQVFPFELRD